MPLNGCAVFAIQTNAKDRKKKYWNVNRNVIAKAKKQKRKGKKERKKKKKKKKRVKTIVNYLGLKKRKSKRTMKFKY